MHTAGPWSVVASLPGGAVIVAAKDGAEVADVWGDNGLPAAANARLIAAAPDLLEACASVWLMLADTGDNELRLIADECRKAIAKATEPRP